tara:strand:+ start:38 stop:697 length:660 start_codon:yes stop_codon:yes gene_type:complete
MKKLIILLLFIPLVSFGQTSYLEIIENSINSNLPDFTKVKDKITYIKKFKTWEHFIDHFETREQLKNFFGDAIIDEYIAGSGLRTRSQYDPQRLLKGLDRLEASKKYSEYYRINLFNKTSYYSPSSSTSGNISYNSLSNSIDYNEDSTYSEGGSIEVNYNIIFKFSKAENGESWQYSNKIEEWKFNGDKNISNRRFINLIKKLYPKSKKEEYKFMRKKK